jgi:hypothetical protein
MEDKKNEVHNSAASLYSKLESRRSPFLMRARDCAKYTLPTLIKPTQTDNGGAVNYPTPWQGMGARGVNNLSSKLLLALFPPNSPFFKLQIDDFTLEQLTQQEGMRAQVEEGLAKIERAVQYEIEAGAIRVGVFEGVKHLVTTGNCLLYLPDSGGIRVFHLDRYVVQRDVYGNVLDIVVEEMVSPATLDAETQAFLGYNTDADKDKTDKELDQDRNNLDRNKTVKIYTHVYLEGNKWEVYQESKGKQIPGSFGTYPKDKTPWIPVRFTRVDGEDYGRGYVEEYLGDIKSLDGLSQAIVEGSAIAAKTVFLVNPNGTTSPRDLKESENGDIIEGLETDVSVLGLDKYNDYRVALETINSINERLSYAFLLNSAIQRSGERVTAEEIRYMANELEAALGGIYSILSQELQLPIVNRLMFSMERQKKLPVLPKGTVNPVIVTGMEALGRGNDLNKLQQFLQTISSTLGPEAMMTYINPSDAITRVGTALGIDTKGLVKSQEQIQQEQQAAAQAQQQQMMMEQGLAPAINQVGNAVTQGMADGSKEALAARSNAE